MSPLAVQSKAIEIVGRGATVSTVQTLRHAASELSALGGSLLARYPAFDDPLTRYLKSPEADWPQVTEKVLREFTTYRLLLKQEPAFPADFASFLKLLSSVHTSLGKGATTYRTGPVFIVPDDRGNVTEFPSARQCEGILHDLYIFLSARLRKDPALCSLVTYVTLIYAHPFDDGNGRTARTMYNVITHLGTNGRHFVPIGLVSAINPANFLVRLRRVFYENDWLCLQQFFAAASAVSVALQRTEPGAAAGPADDSKSGLTA